MEWRTSTVRLSQSRATDGCFRHPAGSANACRWRDRMTRSVLACRNERQRSRSSITAGRRAFSPTFPVTQRHAVNRRNRGAGLQTGRVRLVCRTPPSVAGRGACSSLRILRSLPACSRRERSWRLPTASDGACATRPPTARNPSELPAAPGAPGGRRACCAARAP